MYQDPEVEKSMTRSKTGNKTGKKCQELALER